MLKYVSGTLNHSGTFLLRYKAFPDIQPLSLSVGMLTTFAAGNTVIFIQNVLVSCSSECIPYLLLPDSKWIYYFR